jgi:chemotaxis protein CheZ
VSERAREDRQQVIRRVRAALWAIEHDDEATWRVQVDALIEWRNQPLVQGLARLARELGVALGESDAASIGSSLPEACSRLEHVVRVSEDASHRTLDLIEQCSGLLARIGTPASRADAEALAGIRMRLAEMTAAQGYQDLNGQVLMRVVDLVRCVHAGLGAPTADAPPLHLPTAPQHGHGPSVAGVDPAPASQDEANDLLSALGL